MSILPTKLDALIAAVQDSYHHKKTVSSIHHVRTTYLQYHPDNEFYTEAQYKIDCKHIFWPALLKVITGPERVSLKWAEDNKYIHECSSSDPNVAIAAAYLNKMIDDYRKSAANVRKKLHRHLDKINKSMLEHFPNWSVANITMKNVDKIQHGPHKKKRTAAEAGIDDEPKTDTTKVVYPSKSLPPADFVAHSIEDFVEHCRLFLRPLDPFTIMGLTCVWAMFENCETEHYCPCHIERTRILFSKCPSLFR
jgi:hypothetical protein